MSCIAPRCGKPCGKPVELGAVFCGEHLAAPAAQRGGWLSAERRRRIVANSVDESLDASNVSRRLWVGGKPPFDRHLPEFDVLVLCAQEIQPKVIAFRGTILRVPLPDDTLTNEQVSRALMGGRVVGDALARGSRVLVTCAQGINRSALVATLGLGLVTHLSTEQLILLIRTKRDPSCLSNKHFRMILHRYIGDGRRPVKKQAER